MNQAEPPYQRIAAEIRQRIAAGTLRPGDRVPSTREIIRRWGVAMATASKVLATLRQEGLVEVRPGIGTVVAVRSPERAAARATPRPASRESGQSLTRDRVVHAAIRIADAEGAAALSMRRVAADVGVSTMALYRHVSGKEELILLMADTALAEQALPSVPPSGWRARLELIARLQWDLYRRHPWLAQAMSFNRPLLVPSALAHGEWVMGALAGLGLSPDAMINMHATLASYTRGTAVNFESEAQAQQDTGITDDQWMESQDSAMADLFASGDHPIFADTLGRLEHDFNLDTLFEFGLQRLLDGLATLVQPPPDEGREAS